MKLIIFGATGSVGLPLVRQAIEQGHHVTAFARHPEKLTSFSSNLLTVWKGDVLDADQVEQAVAHHDAVLCVIGDGGKGKVRAAGTKNIINAMKRKQVKRLICQTTLGLGESRGNLNFLWKYIMFGMLLRKAFKDHKLQEQYLLHSGLDYTIVRPSALTDGPLTQGYRIGFDGTYKKLRLTISRSDVADFILRELKTGTYLKKPVSISD